MANPPRQYHPGYWYHVYARSVEELPLFQTDEDRRWFVDKLDEVLDRRQVTLGSLCLMDTHYHALVRMGPVPLDRALNGLHNAYTKHFNAVHEREGSLFNPRPGADIVLSDEYLLQLVPYIHRNPVEAGLVAGPEEYFWSTDFKFRLQPAPDPILEFSCWEFPPHFKRPDRDVIYRERLDEPMNLDRTNGYIGTEDEWEELDRRKTDRGDYPRERRGRRTLEEIARDQAEGSDFSVPDLKEPGRTQAAAAVRHQAMAEMYHEGYGPKEIADFFNRTKSTVNYAVDKIDS